MIGEDHAVRGSLRLLAGAAWYASELAQRTGRVADAENEARLALDLTPDDVKVTLEMDTAKDQWSIAAGSYSCRFTPGTAVAAHLAAERIADKLRAIAAKQLNTLADDIEFGDGKIRSRRNPDNAIPFARVAGTAHWSPVAHPRRSRRKGLPWCRKAAASFAA